MFRYIVGNSCTTLDCVQLERRAILSSYYYLIIIIIIIILLLCFIFIFSDGLNRVLHRSLNMVKRTRKLDSSILYI